RTPGWRNWRYAADLKSAAPERGREGSTPSPGILFPRFASLALGGSRLRRSRLVGYWWWALRPVVGERRGIAAPPAYRFCVMGKLGYALRTSGGGSANLPLRRLHPQLSARGSTRGST